MPETKYCPRHPKTATNLACGKCGKLVCPQCMVHTPVGVRCRDCAQLSRLPTFDVTKGTLVRAVSAGLVLALAGVVAYFFLAPFAFSLPFGSFILIGGIGYLIGEGISLSVNKKRGRTLRFVSGGSTLVSLLAIGYVTLAIFGIANIFLLISGAVALYLSVNRF